MIGHGSSGNHRGPGNGVSAPIRQDGPPNGPCPSMPAPADKPAGFTLLEIMVSLSILAIALLAVFRLQSQTLAMHGRVSFDATAPLLAQETLSRLEARFPEAPESGSGDFGEHWAGFDWRTRVERMQIEPLGEATDDFFRIDITISSTDDDKTYQLTAYRFVR